MINRELLGGGSNLVINSALFIFKTNGSLEEGSSVEAPLYFIKGWYINDDGPTFVKKWDSSPFPSLSAHGGGIIGASSSIEPLDTIDDYIFNASLIQRVDTNFSWGKYFGILSKLILYSGTSASGTAGILQIEFCNENDEVKHTLYSTSRDEIMPILGEMYIGIQCYMVDIEK